jgi:hypothetical protein
VAEEGDGGSVPAAVVLRSSSVVSSDPYITGEARGGEAHAERDPQHIERWLTGKGEEAAVVETCRGISDSGELRCSCVDIRLQRLSLEQRKRRKAMGCSVDPFSPTGEGR